MIVPATVAARELKIGRARLREWTKAGIVPHLKDPETGAICYSLPALRRWQERLGELAAEQQRGSAA